MKKLILILLLLPLFCSSQVLFDKPMSECYINENTNEFSSFQTLKGSKIYIDSDYLVIDIVTDVRKYKIVNKTEYGDFIDLELLQDGKEYLFSYDTDLESKKQWLTLCLKSNKKERISYTHAF